jgi:hypothetical protein
MRRTSRAKIDGLCKDSPKSDCPAAIAAQSAGIRASHLTLEDRMQKIRFEKRSKRLFREMVSKPKGAL